MAVESPTVESQPAQSGAPLSQPLYGATIAQAITRFFRKYATFSGRASRSEFWWFYLMYAILGIATRAWLDTAGTTSLTMTADDSIVVGPGFWIVWAVVMLVALALVVPSLAVTWRRLHDTNRSGRYYFIALIPLLGPVILIILLALPSNPAGARFDH